MIKFVLISLLILTSLNALGHARSSNSELMKSQLHRAYQLAASNQVTKAMRTLETLERQLKKQSNHPLLNDTYLLKARIQYGKRQYKKSLDSYEHIDKGSENWISSVEERAWAKVQMGHINEAIADSHTLMSPLFLETVSPEAFFLSAYVSHRTCDFVRVFKIIEDFKKVSESKILALESQASKKKDSKVAWQLKHYEDVIGKLHLIEADSIQRLYLDQNFNGSRHQAGKVHQPGPYDLIFPYDKEDVWVDEIDQIKVNAENCPILLSRKVVSK